MTTQNNHALKNVEITNSDAIENLQNELNELCAKFDTIKSRKNKSYLETLSQIDKCNDKLNALKTASEIVENVEGVKNLLDNNKSVESDYNKTSMYSVNKKVSVKATLDNIMVKYDVKPSLLGEGEMKSLSKRCNKQVLLTPTELKDVILSGITSILSHFKGNHRTNNTYLASNCIGFDFDNNDSAESILDVLNNNKIDTFLMYKTFSYTDEYKKYRVVLLFDRDLTFLEHKEIYLGIESMFSEFGIKTDKTKDVARIFFGTNKKDYITFNPNTCISVDKFIELYCIPSRLPLEETRVKRKIQSITKDFTIKDRVELECGEVKLFNNFDFNKCAENCKLFNDFINLKRLYHNDLFILATNLRFIVGGQKLFYDKLDEYNNRTDLHTFNSPPYSDNNYSIMKVAIHYNYKPFNLSNSPHEEDRVYNCLVDTVTMNLVEQIEEFTVNSLEDNRNLLTTTVQNVYNNCLNGTAKKVNVIVGSTGLGKTTNILEYIDKDILVVCKTHKNIDDFLFDAKNKKQKTILSTPKTPMFSLDSTNDIIATYNKCKKFSEVKSFIKLIAENKNNKFNSDDVQLAVDFLNEITNYSKLDYTICTTHSKFTNVTFKHKIAFIDECPSQYFYVTGKIHLSTLKKYENNLTDEYKILNDAIKYVEKVDVDITNEAPYNNYDLVRKFNELLVSENINVSNLIDFLQAEYIVVNNSDEFGKIVTFGYLRKPKNDDMYKIIFTSTPDKDMLNKVYGADNVEYFILPETELQGDLIQHIKHSYSKSSLSDSRVEYILNNIDDSFKVITYKDCKKLFPNNLCDFHYGFTEGHNDLIGDNLAVVGAMQPDPNVLKIKAALLGVDLITINSDSTKMRRIKYNGFEFTYNTYENEVIRNIQLFYIYSQLVQSVGRARLVDNNTFVQVFASLPLKQAKFIQNNKTKK